MCFNNIITETKGYSDFPKVYDLLGNSDGFKILTQLAPQRRACNRNSPILGSLKKFPLYTTFSGPTKYLVIHCKGHRVQLNGLSRTISIFLENKTYVCSLPILLVLVLLAEATPAVPTD